MRWPIQYQLLLPMLVVVALSLGLASVAGAFVAARSVRYEQQQNLRRVSSALANASFPLTENVLVRMAALSGAEFVVIDQEGGVETASLKLSSEDVHAWAPLQPHATFDDLSSSSLRSVNGREYLVARMVLHRRSPDDQPGSLLVLVPEDHWWKPVWQAIIPPLVAGAVAICCAVFLTTFVARRHVVPLERLNSQVSGIAGGVFSPMPLPTRDDEYRDIMISINRMVEYLRQYDRRIRDQERLRTLEQLGAGMAHQLRNWVTGARIAFQLDHRESKKDAYSESFDVGIRQLELMESYLRRFLVLGRGDKVPKSSVDMTVLVDDVLSLVQPTCRHAGIKLRYTAPDKPLFIEGNSDSLRQLLVNLLLNAVEAAMSHTSASPLVKVTLKQDEFSRVILSILDSGSGPSQGVQERMFEPFVTEKEDGTGLGLSVAREIAVAHTAQIRWSRDGGMTCFAVEFPGI